MTDKEFLEMIKGHLHYAENGGDVADVIIMINERLGLDKYDGLPE